MRASNIPVKRTSEGIETTQVLSGPTVLPAAADISTTIPSVFPVKTVLKRLTSKIQIQAFEKENIDPFTGARI